MELGEFHTRAGLTFRRNADGTLRIRIYPGARSMDVPIFEITLTEQEWQSVLGQTAWNPAFGDAGG